MDTHVSLLCKAWKSIRTADTLYPLPHTFPPFSQSTRGSPAFPLLFYCYRQMTTSYLSRSQQARVRVLQSYLDRIYGYDSSDSGRLAAPCSLVDLLISRGRSRGRYPKGPGPFRRNEACGIEELRAWHLKAGGA